MIEHFTEGMSVECPPAIQDVQCRIPLQHLASKGSYAWSVIVAKLDEHLGDRSMQKAPEILAGRVFYGSASSVWAQGPRALFITF